MVAIDHDLAFGNVGNAVDDFFLAVFAHALEGHADFDVVREELCIFHQHQFFVVVTESVFGLQLDLEVLAYFLAVQGFFQRREDAVVTTMEINQRMLTIVDHRTVRVGHGVLEGDDAVLCNFRLHAMYPVP